MKLNNKVFLLAGYTFFGITFLLNPIHRSKNLAKILPPPEGVEFVHFGFQQTMSDLLWLNYIQHNWECSRYKDPDNLTCPKRWGYKVLKSAHLLDPKFLEITKYGGIKLAVVQDDPEGAEELFLEGLKYYPTDWEMNYRLAYIYIDEIKNNEKAARYLEIAANYGAPWWAKSLASRLYSKSGKKQLSFTVLRQLYDETKNPEVRERLEKRLAALASEIRQIASPEKQKNKPQK